MEIPNEAGPELDALIAECIMGKQWYINQHGRYFLIDPESALLDVVQPCPPPPPERFSEAARMNNGHPYSTKIAEAWRVVEHILSYGAETAIYEYFCAGFRDDPLSWMLPEAEACLLICRTALVSYDEADI